MRSLASGYLYVAVTVVVLFLLLEADRQSSKPSQPYISQVVRAQLCGRGAVPRLPSMPFVSQPPRMTADEIRLLRQMVHEQGKKPSEVAVILQRSLGSACRQLSKTRPTTMGRPLALTPRQINKLIALTEAMVEEADANYEVTLPMVLHRSRLKVSERTAAGPG